MKLSKRLWRIAPFLVIAYWIFKDQIADSGGAGLVHAFLFLLKMILGIVTFLVACFAIFRSWESDKIQLEPIATSIFLSALLLVATSIVYPAVFLGSISITAESKRESGRLHRDLMKFRTRGRVQIHRIYTDFGGYNTFDYKQNKDTLIIEKPREVEYRYVLSNRFLIQGKTLVPLTEQGLRDTSEYSVFLQIQTVK